MKIKRGFVGLLQGFGFEPAAILICFAGARLIDCGSRAVLQPLRVTGSHGVKNSSTYSYPAASGSSASAWPMAGFRVQSGFSIDSDGNPTLTSSAGGSFRITVRDSCGAVVTLDGRVTNSGYRNSTTAFAKALNAGRNCPDRWSDGGCLYNGGLI